ncbi:MAG: hypothetical protein MJ252_23245, partial [archaeon]|nr:hypothetical protein [archaeon]
PHCGHDFAVSSINEPQYSSNKQTPHSMHNITKLQNNFQINNNYRRNQAFPNLNSAKPKNKQRAMSAKRIRSKTQEDVSPVNITLHTFRQYTKDELLSETLKLKSEVNELKAKINRARNIANQKKIEIEKKEKGIQFAIMEEKNLKGQNGVYRLKNQAQIYKLKNHFKAIRIELEDQRLDNEKLRAEIHERSKIPAKRRYCDKKIEIIKESVDKYLYDMQIYEINHGRLKSYEGTFEDFQTQHYNILNLQKRINYLQNDRDLLNNLKSKNELKIKKLNLKLKDQQKINDKIKKEIERLKKEKEEQKGEEEMKANLIKKIKRIETEVQEAREKSIQMKQLSNKLRTRNEEIEKVMAEKKEINKEVKPIDFSKYKHIEQKNEIDPKICLLNSLINESKRKQKEYNDIIGIYNDYSSQKQKIKDEAITVDQGEEGNSGYIKYSYTGEDQYKVDKDEEINDSKGEDEYFRNKVLKGQGNSKNSDSNKDVDKNTIHGGSKSDDNKENSSSINQKNEEINEKEADGSISNLNEQSMKPMKKQKESSSSFVDKSSVAEKSTNLY